MFVVKPLIGTFWGSCFLGVRGRSDFSRFDPGAGTGEAPLFSNFLVRPRSEDLWAWGAGEVFVAQNRRTLAERAASSDRYPTTFEACPHTIQLDREARRVKLGVN